MKKDTNTGIKNCTGVILAGGENRRMPVLKAFIKIKGERIIERNLKIMKKLFKENFIVTNQPEFYAYLDAPLLGDVYDARGPMTGVFTALLNSSSSWVFISACDMPFLNEHLIRHMALKRGKKDAVVSRRGKFIEPLFAFYAKQLASPMEKSILTGKTGLNEFLLDKKVQYIGTREIEKIDRRSLSFINLNTPADVERYLHDDKRRQN
jgi:molybdopterin-guanine dinucleotide biosynthesis protein A